jgi:hypothetical protein
VQDLKRRERRPLGRQVSYFQQSYYEKIASDQSFSDDSDLDLENFTGHNNNNNIDKTSNMDIDSTGRSNTMSPPSVLLQQIEDVLAILKAILWIIITLLVEANHLLLRMIKKRAIKMTTYMQITQPF